MFLVLSNDKFPKYWITRFCNRGKSLFLGWAMKFQWAHDYYHIESQYSKEWNDLDTIWKLNIFHKIIKIRKKKMLFRLKFNQIINGKF